MDEKAYVQYLYDRILSHHSLAICWAALTFDRRIVVRIALLNFDYHLLS